ncbi:hypothetical protein ABVT39_007206 [Epinephelus coioides]
MPIFLNERLKWKDKRLYDARLLKSGFVQIKDIMYEFMPGFLKCNSIFECIAERYENVNLPNIENVYSRIIDSIPAKWREIICSEEGVDKDNTIPDLYVSCNEKWKLLCMMNAKDFYKICATAGERLPASLNYWRKVLPDITEEEIWGGWRVVGNSLGAEDFDIRLRQAKIFPKIVVHQLDNDASEM